MLWFKLTNVGIVSTIDAEFYQSDKCIRDFHLAICVHDSGEHHFIILYQFDGAADTAAIEREDIILVIHCRNLDWGFGMVTLFTPLINVSSTNYNSLKIW